MSITEADLDSIKVLFRRDDSLELFGVPYLMRPGQSPRDIFRAGNTRGKWIWLGGPGWWGSMSKPEQALVKAFLVKHKDDVPTGPNEWSVLSKAVGRRSLVFPSYAAGTPTAQIRADLLKLEGLSGKRGSYMRVPGKMGRGLGGLGAADSKPHLKLRFLSATDEWMVAYVVGMKTDDAKSYYASDKADAVATMADMQKRIDAGLSGLGAARDLNDNDREQWVNNDEGLYSWWKSTRQPIRTFVRENRAELTEAINKVLNAPPRQKSWRDY